MYFHEDTDNNGITETENITLVLRTNNIISIKNITDSSFDSAILVELTSPITQH